MHIKDSKKLNFLNDLAMVASDTMPVPEESASFHEAFSHPNATSCE